jgi:hypothetical protein
MRRHAASLTLLLSSFSLLAAAAGADVRIEASSGETRRIDAVVQATFALKDLGLNSDAAEVAALKPGTLGVWSLSPDHAPTNVRPLEAERIGDSLRLTWVEPGEWPSSERRRWTLAPAPPAGFRSPWSWVTTADGQRELHHATRGLVFRYVAAPITRDGLPLSQKRAAYIHPFLTPSGKTATGDFSPFHTHHRGFFLAYAKTKRGDLQPDFWNIHMGSAKIVAQSDAVVTSAGPVTARLSARHDWQLRDKSRPQTDEGETIADERWAVTVYDIPGQPAWVWDIASTQTPFGQDLTLARHRYGGMAYRGPEPFVKGTLDVLTSEGADTRAKADQKPARWIDLTGPVADGSSDYVGAVMCDHPSNPRFPNVVRIHPTLLPFFSFVPAHAADMKLAAGEPVTWRYRTMVHDGRPDKSRNEALFADFAAPVEAKLTESR